MQTARARWVASYREARKQARFINAFSDRLRRLDPSLRSFPCQCPGFSFVRLHGDVLYVYGLRADVQLRRAVLNVERTVRVGRLPA